MSRKYLPNSRSPRVKMTRNQHLVWLECKEGGGEEERNLGGITWFSGGNRGGISR